jgi:hypothetical protein
VTLMLSAGMLTALEREVSPAGRGLLLGIFAAAACGAKLTALGMAAIPLGILALMTIEPRRLLKALGCGAIAGLIVLSPWLIRNMIACGNPVFPFATGVFGLGHWTAEQSVVWQTGHSSDASIGERFVALWNQLLRFGIGENPAAGEPWKPQWLVLPWLAIIGLGIGLLQPKLRRWSVMLALMIAAQVGYWLLLTHLQSRFLLPTVAPMSLAAALAIGSLLHWTANPTARRVLTCLIVVGLLSWCSAIVVIFRGEAAGAPAAAVGVARSFAGDDVQPAERRELGMTTFPAVFVNFLMPVDGRILLVGESAPLYYRPDRITYNTVWDRGPLSQIMQDHPDDPGAWVRALREAGYTHILINPSMLQRWERSGWSDPLMYPKNVMAFAKSNLRPIQQYPRGRGEVLFAIPPGGE